MAGRNRLREQQREAAAAIRAQAERLMSTSDPAQAREARDVIIESVDRIVRVVDILEREGA